MRRNWDLLRFLLIELEGIVSGLDRNWTEEYRAYHRCLLIDGGLATGAIIEGGDWADAVLLAPSWMGHDFLSWARNEDTWQRVRAYIEEFGLPDTLEVMTEIAEKRYGPKFS